MAVVAQVRPYLPLQEVEMTDLIEFLRRMLDEDEALARPVDGQRWYLDLGGPEMADHFERWEPARVLREVEAARRILDLHQGMHECSTIRRGTFNGEPYEEIDNCTWVLDSDDCSTVRLLALPHADHPDYREEWRP